MIRIPTTGALAGMLAMALGVLVLTVMDLFAKLLVESGMSAIQVVAMRGWIIMPLMLTGLPKRGGFAALRTQRPVAMVLRGVVGLTAPVLFFTALGSLSLANTTAIFFSAVFIMTALSGLLLHEHVGVHRWLAVVCGFAGVLVIVRPDSESFQLAALLAAGASLAYATLMLSGKRLSATESTFKLVFYFNLIGTTGASLALPWVYKTPQPQELLMVVLVALLALAGHLLLTQAIRIAPIATIAPLEYTALVWAILWGWLVWNETPDAMTAVGMGIIVASGIYIAQRENLARRG